MNFNKIGMKKALLFGFALTFFSFAFAQDKNLVTIENYSPELREYGIKGTLYYNDYRMIEGTAFLYNSWTNAELKLNGSEKTFQIKSDIDIYSNSLVYFSDNLSKLVMIDKSIISSIRFNDKQIEKLFVLTKIPKLLSDSIAMLAEVLVDGNIRLIDYRKKNIINIGNSSGEEKYTGFFKDKHDYFINTNSLTYPVQFKKRSLYRILPEKEGQIKSYCQQKGYIFFINKKRTIDIIAYINTL